jgi:hypothetical protein
MISVDQPPARVNRRTDSAPVNPRIRPRTELWAWGQCQAQLINSCYNRAHAGLLEDFACDLEKPIQ